MKKFTIATLSILSAISVNNYANAGIYISGSFSTMMGTEFSTKNKPTADDLYYTIDCSDPLNAYNSVTGEGFCTSGSLIWTVNDDQKIDIEADGGTTFGGAIGYYSEKYPLRFELEYMNIANEMKSATYTITHSVGITTLPYNIDWNKEKFTFSTFMANAYYGFNLGVIRPYVGFGLGYIGGEINNYINPGNVFEVENGLGFQFMGGVEYPLGRTGLYLGAEYRYIDLSMLNAKELGASSAIDSGNITGLLFKVRYAFNEYPSAKKKPAARRPSERARRPRDERRGQQRGRGQAYDGYYYGERNYYNNGRSY
ncbi:MAG: hypothetical protein LBU68_00740 [Rickettsiales bacterium]|jgi:outer membrane protein W|nr:hypothetical protein [Rickettsiales bacterium]